MKNFRDTFRGMKPDEMREASREAEIDSMAKIYAPIEYVTPVALSRRRLRMRRQATNMCSTAWPALPASSSAVSGAR